MNEVKSGRREMLLVNGREVPVAVVRNRRARRYVLRLRDDGLARLTIPRNGSAKEAWEFAQRQGAWLERQLQDLASRPVRPREWRVGIEILFRGEPVRIQVVADRSKSTGDDSASLRSPSPLPSPPGEGELFADDWTDWTTLVTARPSGKLVRGGSPASAPGAMAGRRPLLRDVVIQNAIRVGGELIHVADTTGDLRPEIERHLRTLATKELPARTLEFAALHQLSVNRVTVRAQRSRWGSCSFKRIISLNWRLIQTPSFVRDYIILHELMHLRQMNHSARFWREVERVCPDYRTAKRWLKDNPGLLDQ